MLKCLKADLHIHTCLSPCAEAEMTPTAIVGTAAARGLDVIGICDHNSTENVRALATAAEGGPLTVLGGMEVTSQEEVHVLGLFGGSESDDALQAIHLAITRDMAVGLRDDETLQWLADNLM